MPPGNHWMSLSTQTHSHCQGQPSNCVSQGVALQWITQYSTCVVFALFKKQDPSSMAYEGKISSIFLYLCWKWLSITHSTPQRIPDQSAKYLVHDKLQRHFMGAEWWIHRGVWTHIQQKPSNTKQGFPSQSSSVCTRGALFKGGSDSEVKGGVCVIFTDVLSGPGHSWQEEARETLRASALLTAPRSAAMQSGEREAGRNTLPQVHGSRTAPIALRMPLQDEFW